MASTVWSGVIGFGMVSIPVKLFAATGSQRVSFHLLHDKCQTRIKEVRWCPHCDQEVAWENVVKGYEMSKDEYIPMTDEDFEKLPIPSKNIIDVSSFAKAEEVDALYFEKNYYLLPDKQGQKAFNLFITALETKNLLAIGKITIRSRERLCAIRGLGGNLVLTTLLYADEIKVDTDSAPPRTKIAKAELDMALSLIDIMTAPFDGASYRDDYKAALEEMIAAKASGKNSTKSKAIKPKEVVDLMEALKASISKAGASSARAAAKPKKTTAKVATAKTKSKAKAKAKIATKAKTVTAKSRTKTKVTRKSAAGARARK